MPLGPVFGCACFLQIAVSTPDVFDAAAAVEKTTYDVSASPSFFSLLLFSSVHVTSLGV